MMRVLITAVTYNSYSELIQFLDSVDKAFSNTNNTYLRVCVADNSTEKESYQLNKYKFDIQYYSFDNKGYFGGATNAINRQDDIDTFDYVIISNVDLQIDNSFFYKLSSCEDPNVGWISPSIMSTFENRDKGLGLAQRPTKVKLYLLTIIHKHPFLLFLIENTIYRRKTLFQKKCESQKVIYSGHGSFIILTKYFIQSYPRLHYPMFLFGEELFLGELVRQKSMRVVYHPELKIYDSEHVSTSQMPSRFRCKCQYDSLMFILDTFYK